MEAVAVFEFTPSEPNDSHDQLTFNAGEQIIITSFTDAAGWYRAELHKQCLSNNSSPNNSLNNSQNALHPNVKSYSSSKLQHSTSRSSNYHNNNNNLSNNFQTSSFNSPQHSPHNNSLQLNGNSHHHNRQHSFHSLQSRRSSSTTASQSSFHNRKIVRGFAPKSYFELKPCPWFYGPATREMAEEILQNCPEGEFIIRQNVDTLVFCLSVQCLTLGGVQHYKILRDQVGNYKMCKKLPKNNIFFLKFDSFFHVFFI